MTAIARLLKPLDHFLRIETASGLVLLVAAGLALAWANSGGSATYEQIWDAKLPPLNLSLHFLINDGLMTIFFLVVGLEIRSEIHDGALSTPSQAALPLVAGAGGILIPALVYAAFAGNVSMDGWAVPTATDIAFAVGVLALLGRRVNAALRVLLLAVAIADDIAAVLVIAFFYAQGIEPVGIGLSVAGALGVWLFHRFGVNAWIAIAVPGALVWYGLLKAGIHPALAGVVVGLLTPMSAGRAVDAVPPAVRLQMALHPWVAFGVMPIFALANAGVRIAGLDLGSDRLLGLAGGISLGLLVGKPVGIIAAVALAVRCRLCTLPDGVTPAGVAVIGFMGGIGFTMSIFIAALAFADPNLLSIAKFGVLLGSAGAAVAGLLLGFLVLPRARA